MPSLTEVQSLASSLFTEYQLRHWTFKFDRAVRRYGLTNYTRKEISVSKIYVLSPKVTLYHIRNTLLHEIAHAIVGPKNGHNQIWRTKALSIGCDGKTCGSAPISVKKRYRIFCGCGANDFTRHRKPSKLHEEKCGKCKGKLHLICM